MVNENDYDVVDAIVASDNYGLGYVSGQDVAERFPDGAKIGIMHSPTSESCIVTVNAFWDAIKEHAKNPEAYVNVAEADGKGNMEQSFTQATDILQAHDDIDLFYCVNDQSAFGVIQAIKEAGKAGGDCCFTVKTVHRMPKRCWGKTVLYSPQASHLWE